MTPLFRIKADGQDSTAHIADRLLSLSITDEAGIKSDTAEIVLDNRGSAIALPRTGAELEISLGWRDQPLIRQGLYTVDELVLSAPPDTLTIRARAANYRRAAKAPRDAAWEDVSIADIARTIATRHGLPVSIGEGIQDLVLDHIDQTAESDLSFLTRLAREHDLIAKAVNGKLVVARRGQAKSASGKNLPPVTVHKGDCEQWRYEVAERGKYGAVTARWRDVATARDEQITVGTDAPEYLIRRRYANHDEALAAARAKLASFNRGTATLEVSLAPACGNVWAEGPLQMRGFIPAIDHSNWIINRVCQRLDSGGWKTTMEAQTAK